MRIEMVIGIKKEIGIKKLLFQVSFHSKIRNYT